MRSAVCWNVELQSSMGSFLGPTERETWGDGENLKEGPQMRVGIKDHNGIGSNINILLDMCFGAHKGTVSLTPRKRVSKIFSNLIPEQSQHSSLKLQPDTRTFLCPRPCPCPTAMATIPTTLCRPLEECLSSECQNCHFIFSLKVHQKPFPFLEINSGHLPKE